MTPFVAAAAQRLSQEDLFDLTARLHQVMLSAAGLAARQRGHHSGGRGPAAGALLSLSSGAGPAGSALDMQQSRSIQQTGLEVDSSWQQEDLQVDASAKQRGSRRGAQPGSSQKDVSGKLAARMQRLAARKEASQQRLQRRQERQQSRGGKQPAAASTVAAPSSRVHITDLGGQSYAWGSAGPAGSSRRNNSLDAGMGLGAAVTRQQLLGDVQAAKVAEEDTVHPWSWDVTQPLTILSGGVKVCAGAAVGKLPYGRISDCGSRFAALHGLSATCRTNRDCCWQQLKAALRVCQQTHCFACVSCRPRCLCVQLADLPLSTGLGGFLLARAACEMLCEAMAAAWTAGRAAPVRRLMLLPQGGNSARVVSAREQHQL